MTGALEEAQGVLHKFLHAGPVQGHHVGPLKLLHVPHGEGVVVEAGHRPVSSRRTETPSTPSATDRAAR